MARIGIAGFQHETNSFAPTPARFEDFERPGGWPGLTRGPALFEAVGGMNLPVAGFIDAARNRHALVPLLWCAAPPSGPVERNAYENIAAMLLDALAAAQPLDALYLDLHGAMVTAHLEDGEGELLRRIRALVGRDLPVLASLDLHANLTPAMIAEASALVAYRSYPHVDMAETGTRTAALLDRLLRRGAPYAKAFRPIPFLIPLPWQCTLIEPARSLYGLVAALETGPVASVSFAAGFPPADIADCGPSALAYAETEAAAEAAVERLARAVEESEPAFAGRVHEADEAVRQAMTITARAGRPVVLADSEDNPGAGADGNGVDLLAALIRNDAADALLGLLNDPAAAAAAHAAGEGARLELALGAHLAHPDRVPLRTRVLVERLGDGNFTATGPFYRGARMRLGPMALLRLERGRGVRVAVASRKQQAADRAMFRHLGLEPARQRILVLKSSVHFRADFEDLAAAVLVVAAGGPSPLDHRRLPFRRLRPGLRLMPGGAPFGETAARAGGTRPDRERSDRDARRA